MDIKEVFERRTKMQWRGSDDDQYEEKVTKDPTAASSNMLDSDSEVTLIPQDIRSFVIEFDDKMSFKDPSFIQ